MKTLNSPLFEVNQESNFYKKVKARKDQQDRVNEILSEVASTVGFEANEFVYYGSQAFGFESNTVAYENFKDQLTKKSDRNGVHTFKKTSPNYKTINSMLLEIDEIDSKYDPFEKHDIFGRNNLAASHWIGDRFFFEVKDANITEEYVNSPDRRKRFVIEPVQEVDYKEYMKLALETLD